MFGDLTQRRHLGALLIALDPMRFAGGMILAEAVDRFMAELKQQPGQIKYPGEPEYIQEAKRRREGIPVDPALLDDMNEWAQRLGVTQLK